MLSCYFIIEQWIILQKWLIQKSHTCKEYTLTGLEITYYEYYKRSDNFRPFRWFLSTIFTNFYSHYTLWLDDHFSEATCIKFSRTYIGSRHSSYSYCYYNVSYSIDMVWNIIIKSLIWLILTSNGLYQNTRGTVS